MTGNKSSNKLLSERRYIQTIFSIAYLKMNVCPTAADNTWPSNFQYIHSFLILNGKLWQAGMPVLDNVTNWCSWRRLNFQLHRKKKIST